MIQLTRVAVAAFIISVFTSMLAAEDVPPALVWSQQGPGYGEPGSSGNVYYSGGVFNDVFYTGQLNWGPMAFGMIQTGDPLSALLHDFKTAYVEDATDNGARSAVVVGDYIYFNRNAKPTGIPSPTPRVNRLNSDWTNNVPFYPSNNDLVPEGMTTDGTHLFISVHVSGLKHVIRKFSISNQPDSFTLTKTAEFPIDGASAFRGLSYYKGKIYVVDNAGTKGIYEIDASTGAYTKLGTHIGNGGYQAVRYGNRLFVADGADQSGGANNLTVYTITDGALSASTSYNLSASAGHILGLWGIGVVGNGTAVTGFWVNSSNGWVSFFSCSFSIVTCNRPFADADDDDDVDQDDFGAFQRCFGTDGQGPALPESNYFCSCFDKDGVNGVDSNDMGAFEACLTAPAVLWAPSEDCP